MRSRRVDPDYVVDPDRGSSAVASSRQAEVVNPAGDRERRDDRAGARELDDAVESMPGLSRQQKDRERAVPRGATGELGHPRMERTLPAAGQVRAPLSSRQRKARSAAKRAVQDRLPDTQHAAVQRLLERPQRWREVNDALSQATGDAQALEETTRTQVQRVDRAVQAYERANDRGHVVYSNVRMPASINRSNLEPFVGHNFKAGRVLEFDRFTAGAHTLHELEVGPDDPDAQRTAVFEIQTRRGMYLGRSDSVDDTGHLLPRGMRLRVAGVHTATFRRPDGSTGRRQVIQLTDITPT